MKKYLLAVAVLCVATNFATPAFAFKQLADQFKAKYAGEKANADFKKLVTDAKCYVCHVKGESKKKRNPYGDALHELIEDTKFPIKDYKKDSKNEKYIAQLKEIFKKLEGMESGDKEHKTFADRMKADLLPGGDKEGK